MEALSPADIIALRQELAVAVRRADQAEVKATEACADAANARAINSDLEARNALLALQIEVLKRDRFGQRSERSKRLVDQMELALEAAEATASEDEAANAFVRARPSRQPLPAHLPAAGTVPRHPARAVRRQHAGDDPVREVRAAPQPLNRQRDRYAHEGVDLGLSTLADQIGACTAALKPLHRMVEAHVLAADRLNGDDTTVPVLAKVRTDIAASGPMCATTNRSVVRRRRPRCSTRATGAANIRAVISPTTAPAAWILPPGSGCRRARELRMPGCGLGLFRARRSRGVRIRRGGIRPMDTWTAEPQDHRRWRFGVLKRYRLDL